MSAVPYPHHADGPRVDPPPKPDKAAMRTALDAMFAPDEVVELRVIHKGRKRTDAGYFDGDHREGLVNAAATLNAAGAAVYVNLNRIDPQLLGRYSNRIEDYAKETVTDKDVIRRRGLLIDFDPVRPANTSATDVQVAEAKERARATYQALKAEGWPEPRVGESGNGMHIIYPLDLPNDLESTDLVKGALTGLAARFADEAVNVDQSVFNAGRIIKLYGTVAKKGDHTPNSPWRLSRLVSGSCRNGTVVTADQLRALHPKGNGADPKAWSAWGHFDLPAFLSRLGIAYDQDMHEGAARYKLEHCPFNAEHGRGEAAIFQQPDGRLGFKCQHSSCADKHWQDVRALVDGSREGRASSRSENLGRGSTSGAKAPAGDEFRSGNGASPADDSAGPEWPNAMDPSAYYGLAGEMVKAIGPHTESDPVALLIQILVAFGVWVGRTPYVQVEGDRHYANLFALLMGGTSKGRKGTSWGRVRSIFEGILGWPRVVSGLSSGEGLKWQVRDPITKLVKDKKSGTMEEVVDEGVHDKRLLVIEPEFAAVTRVVARQGNNLTSTVREAWDIGNLSTFTRHDPITATGAHIAIIGHVTVHELRAELTHTDTANGFANRFLFLCVKRSKFLPFGGEDLPESVVIDFAQRLDRAGNAARRVGRVKMTEAARRDWECVYPCLSEGRPGLFGAATARAEAQVVRLAMVYALLDEKAQIEVPHLRAALSVWEYCEASAQYVFGASLGDPVADGILRAVQAAGKDGMTRTQISGLFHRNYPAGRIEAALDLLARSNLVQKVYKDTGGRPRGRAGRARCATRPSFI